VPRDQSSLTPKKTPKFSRKAHDSHLLSVRPTSFCQVASLQLTPDSLGKTHFPMDGVIVISCSYVSVLCLYNQMLIGIQKIIAVNTILKFGIHCVHFHHCCCHFVKKNPFNVHLLNYGTILATGFEHLTKIGTKMNSCINILMKLVNFSCFPTSYS